MMRSTKSIFDRVSVSTQYHGHTTFSWLSREYCALSQFAHISAVIMIAWRGLLLSRHDSITIFRSRDGMDDLTSGSIDQTCQLGKTGMSPLAAQSASSVKDTCA